jgi:hypothetical protein
MVGLGSWRERRSRSVGGGARARSAAAPAKLVTVFEHFSWHTEISRL